MRKKIQKLRLKKELKNESGSLSLGTSKQNYIDPRIIVAFTKHFNIPINKFFTKQLIDKFSWSLTVDETFRF